MTRNGVELDSPAVRAFCQRWKIRKLSVFGSVLRDDFHPQSDIDFLADFDEDEQWDLFDEVRMQDELAAILGRPVDILSRYAVDTDSNWLFRRAVLSSAETVYAR